MSYEELSLKGFIDEMKEVSSGPHPRKFCFVLGAGASLSSGIKSGQELVTIWDAELQLRNEKAHIKWKKDLNITEENKYSFYSKFYERRFRRQPVDGYNYLEKLMEHARPSIGYVMLSYLLTKTRHNVVITTNFDHLMEDAVNYYEQKIPLVIGHESLAHYVTKHITRPTIIKIHRDLLLDPKNRADELEVLHDNWKKALGEVFAEYHPIFIGYAGNDNSLMDFLIENSEKFLTNEWLFPYWMIYKKDDAYGKVLAFLEKSEGYLIRHNGFDEVMCFMGTAFDYKLPSKEDFLNDAEERFQMLSNSIDRFTEVSLGGKEFEQGEHVEDKTEEGDIGHVVEKITSQADQQRLYREAIVLHNNGNYEEAREIEKQLVSLNATNSRYHYAMGVTLHEMKKYEEAEYEKRKAVELEPENARYHNSLSNTLHEMHRYQEAENESRKAVELEPENAGYHDSLGITLQEMEKYEEAAIEKRKAVELEPDNARYHDSLGNTLHAMNRYQEAENESRKAVELEPENASYHNSLGVTLYVMEKYEEAEYEKRKAVELEPENASYRDSLSNTLHAMNRYKEAENESRKAVEIEPENASYHNSLGVTLHVMEKYEEAEYEKRKAVELEPENASYRDSLGITLQEMEKYEEAEKEVRRAIELEPDNTKYIYHLDIVLDAMKEFQRLEKG